MSIQPLPEVTDDTAAFWSGGADGSLHIHRCNTCQTWFHPPAPVCPECLSMDVAAQPNAGRATVKGFTVNVQPWSPDMIVPYVIAIVDIDDAPGVQLTTRLVDVDPSDVHIGLAVEVTFVQVDDIYLPLFRPAGVSAEAVAS